MKTIQEIKINRCEECPFVLIDSLDDSYGCFVGGNPDDRKVHWEKSGTRIFDQLIPEDCPLKTSKIQVTT